jgi:ferritin-like metal-binding protein YciE
MKLGSLRDLLIYELKDLYSAENQLVKALPRVAKKSRDAGIAGRDQGAPGRDATSCRTA